MGGPATGKKFRQRRTESLFGLVRSACSPCDRGEGPLCGTPGPVNAFRDLVVDATLRRTAISSTAHRKTARRIATIQCTRKGLAKKVIFLLHVVVHTAVAAVNDDGRTRDERCFRA